MSERENGGNYSGEEKSEKEIIDGILKQIKPENTENYLQFILSFGDKSLEISIGNISNRITTYIENVTGDKQPGATMYLYKAAKIIMQNAVNKLNKEMSYTLMTNNQKMKAWAETTGKEIFAWDSTLDDQEEKYRYNFTKKFIPEKNILQPK